MRIAWLGSARDGGGVPGMGGMLLGGLLDRGVQVDMFTTETEGELARSLRGHKNLNVIRIDPRWSWGRWYSRKAFLAFMSSTIARTRAYNRLSDLLMERNAQSPYDCIFQLSQIELFKLGRHRKQLPPIVVYPCSHAAGELRWHRRESIYARQSENVLMHYLVRLFLIYRSCVQRRELRKPALILGPSNRFVELLTQDYGIERGRLAVLRHPVILNSEPLAGKPERNATIRLLFISRISVRKGFEQIVELSNRLDDLAGQVRIDVIGGWTQWSDYRAHLKELNSRVAKYLGEVPYAQMGEIYSSAHAILVPSMYEPGSLVVGEATHAGLAVVASEEVGPTEVLSKECCRTFPAGNVAEFERQTRALIQDVRARPNELRAAAHAQAAQWFAAGKIADQLFGILADVAAERRRSAALCASHSN